MGMEALMEVRDCNRWVDWETFLVEGKKTVLIKPPINEEDHSWLKGLWLAEWGGNAMISKGCTHHIQDLCALIAWKDGNRMGAATYRLGTGESELLSINSVVSASGIGSALLSAFERIAIQAGMRRAWLITSNDNLDALRFYQRRGYRIVAVYPDAVDKARQFKSSIPLVGFYDIPVHDELELEKWL